MHGCLYVPCPFQRPYPLHPPPYLPRAQHTIFSRDYTGLALFTVVSGDSNRLLIAQPNSTHIFITINYCKNNFLLKYLKSTYFFGLPCVFNIKLFLFLLTYLKFLNFALHLYISTEQ